MVHLMGFLTFSKLLNLSEPLTPQAGDNTFLYGVEIKIIKYSKNGNVLPGFLFVSNEERGKKNLWIPIGKSNSWQSFKK